MAYVYVAETAGGWAYVGSSRRAGRPRRSEFTGRLWVGWCDTAEEALRQESLLHMSAEVTSAWSPSIRRLEDLDLRTLELVRREDGSWLRPLDHRVRAASVGMRPVGTREDPPPLHPSLQRWAAMTDREVLDDLGFIRPGWLAAVRQRSRGSVEADLDALDGVQRFTHGGRIAYRATARVSA